MLSGKIVSIPTLETVTPHITKRVPEAITPKCGIHYDVPFETYLKWGCFSKSAIPYLKKSPAHYREYRSTPLDTKAIRMGRLFDTLILEPDLFYSEFIVPPDKYRAPEKKPTLKNPRPKLKDFDWSPYTTFCKQWKEDWERAGKTVISMDDINTAQYCMEVIASKPNILKLLEGTKQVSIVWDDPETGVRCKARFDVLNEDNITDLKKTKDASWSDSGKGGFKGEILNYGYHTQAALYADGWEVLTDIRLPFNFVAVEDFAPYQCAAYSVREETFITGRIEYREAQLIYRDILAEDKYYGYPDDIIDLDIPAYAIKGPNTLHENEWNLKMGPHFNL